MKNTIPAALLSLAIILGCSGCSSGQAVESNSPESPPDSAAPNSSESGISPVAPDIVQQNEHAPSDSGGKTELILATISDPFFMGLSTIVSEFNDESDEYTLVFKDYSEGGQYDAEQAKMRLNVDMGSGKYPDLIYFSTGLSPYPFISHGYLSDISEFFDSEIGPGDIAIAKALDINGGIYFISSRFYIETHIASYDRFGDRYYWTLDEYLEIEKNMPPGEDTMYNTTKEYFLRKLSSRYLSLAIDWQAGTCDFNNPDFIEILKASTRINENLEDIENMNYAPGAVRVAEGSIVAISTWINRVWMLAYNEALAGEQLSLIGCPTVDGSCGSDVFIDNPFGIVSQSGNEEGCWEFIKYILENAPTSDNGLSVYLPDLMAEFNRAKSEENGVLGVYLTLTDTDIERFFNLLNEIDTVAVYDEKVLEIIEDESSALFNGERTAEETAELIQSRVSLYVSEQS